MDTQIWYAIFSTIFGGIYGAFSHLGEVSGNFAIKSLVESLETTIRLIPLGFYGRHISFFVRYGHLGCCGPDLILFIPLSVSVLFHHQKRKGRGRGKGKDIKW